MRKHPARLFAAGLSPARYYELRAICRQHRVTFSNYVGGAYIYARMQRRETYG